MRQFLILWIGQLVSLLGSQLTGFALGVWVYQQTQSTTLFALIATLNVLPLIVLAPISGVLVDRWNRRHVMLLSDLGAGVTTLMLAIVVTLNHLPIALIACLVALNAAFNSFLRPAYTAATTQLVPAKHLDRASGLMQTGYSIAQLLAPILGGSLLTTIGLPKIMLLDGVSFAIAVLTQCCVRLPPMPTVGTIDQTGSAASSWIEDFTEAVQFLRHRSALLALLIFFILKNFLSSISYVSITPYVLSFASETVLGIILSLGGVGMLVGGLVLTVLPTARSRIQTIVVFTALGGLTLIMVALKASVPVFMLGAFLFFFGMPLTHGPGQVIFQKKVPMRLQGRVFALNEALAASAVPLGYLAAGPLNDLVFEPMMQPNGLLANSFGVLLGVGASQGTRLLFLVLGLLYGGLTLLLLGYAPLRQVEQLPDALNAPLSSAIASVSEGTSLE